MDASELLIELYGRIVPLAKQAVTGLTTDDLKRAPEGANSIGWLVWHLTRVQDHQIAEMFEFDQVWVAPGWADRFGLACSATYRFIKMQQKCNNFLFSLLTNVAH